MGEREEGRGGREEGREGGGGGERGRRGRERGWRGEDAGNLSYQRTIHVSFKTDPQTLTHHYEHSSVRCVYTLTNVTPSNKTTSFRGPNSVIYLLCENGCRHVCTVARRLGEVLGFSNTL